MDSFLCVVQAFATSTLLFLVVLFVVVLVLKCPGSPVLPPSLALCYCHDFLSAPLD